MPWEAEEDGIRFSGHLTDLMALIMTAYEEQTASGAVTATRRPGRRRWLSVGRVPPFPVTFGVASTEYAYEFDEVVAIADRALLAAKAGGRNRVLVAQLSESVND